MIVALGYNISANVTGPGFDPQLSPMIRYVGYLIFGFLWLWEGRNGTCSYLFDFLISMAELGWA